jgi:SAM-dependent methyltransferase
MTKNSGSSNFPARLVGRARALTGSAWPGGRLILRRAASVARAVGLGRSLSGEDVFTEIYRNNSWADAETVSGRGSTLERTDAIRRALPALLESIGARSLLDAPCGDFNWMRHAGLGDIRYTGADIVPELVERNRRLYAGGSREFVVADITRDALPEADAILCRDCLVHLSFKHIHAALANFKRSGARFLLTTTYPTAPENRDIQTGWWRAVNLQLPPFNFPAPLRLVDEDAGAGKSLGLWGLEKL